MCCRIHFAGSTGTLCGLSPQHPVSSVLTSRASQLPCTLSAPARCDGALSQEATIRNYHKPQTSTSAALRDRLKHNNKTNCSHLCSDIGLASGLSVSVRLRLAGWRQRGRPASSYRQKLPSHQDDKPSISPRCAPIVHLGMLIQLVQPLANRICEPPNIRT